MYGQPPKYFALALCLLMATACSADKPAPKKSTQTASSVPPPLYQLGEVKPMLMTAKDMGKSWTTEQLPDAYKENEFRSCSDTRIKPLGDIQTESAKFGAPDWEHRGANYARLVLVFAAPEDAARTFAKIREDLAKCPKQKKIESKKLPGDKYLVGHDDTWNLSEDSVAGWEHVRGAEKAVYPPSLSNINAFHFFLDYAIRGNMIFTSMYWQRKKPKDDPQDVQNKASEVLAEQLGRFG